MVSSSPLLRPAGTSQSLRLPLVARLTVFFVILEKKDRAAGLQSDGYAGILINSYRVIDVKSHYFVMPNARVGLADNHPRTLRLLGERTGIFTRDGSG